MPEESSVARARWHAAEDRLYPMVMTDPDGYQRVVGVVGALLDELRRRSRTVADLVELERDPDALLGGLPLAPPASLPGDLLVQAACGTRARELVAEQEGERRTSAIAAARAAGEDWVVLEGPATLEQLTGDRFTELHLPTGRALIATVDPYSGGDPFHLEETGGQAGRSRSFGDRPAWLAEHQRWRGEIVSP